MLRPQNLVKKKQKNKCQSRLQAAKHWITTYNGKKIIKGYKNRFGVGLVCAINELKMLGLQFDDQYITQLLQSNEQKIAGRRKRREEKKKKSDELSFESDEIHYYIAGYTSGGAAYGIT